MSRVSFRFVILLLCLGLGFSFRTRYTTADVAKLSFDSCVMSTEETSWANIRIHVDYVERLFADPKHSATAALIRKKTIPSVMDFWEKSMKVRRHTEPLLFKRDCEMNGRPCKSSRPSVCAVDGFEVEIPQTYLSSVGSYSASGSFGQVKKNILKGGPGVLADLVILVDISDLDACAHGEVASAFVCRVDECGRPILGVVHICLSSVDPTSPRSIQELHTTISHELTHVLGFTPEAFPRMRLPNGAPRIPPSVARSVLYTCRVDSQGRPKVRWDVEKDRRDVYRFTFSPGILSSVENDRVGNKCRCPFDPTRTYTSEDIEHCLTHRHECAFAITTPAVVAVSRWFFDCPTLAGAELENQAASDPCSIVDPHWKTRLFKGEYMTSHQDENVQYISPITWAFLDDTGWYRMNYNATTALVRGAFWGYKAGCDFVNSPCGFVEHVSPSAPFAHVDVLMGGDITGGTLTDLPVANAVEHVEPSAPLAHVAGGSLTDLPVAQAAHVSDVSRVPSSSFCQSTFLKPVCASNAIHMVQCSVHPGRIPFQYKSVVNDFNSPLMDFCPTVYNTDKLGCLRDGSSSRCLNAGSGQDTHGMCVNVQCVVGGYTVNGGLCTIAGQRIPHTNGSFIECADPAIVCHKFAYPHVPKFTWALPSAKSSQVSRRQVAKIVKSVKNEMPKITAQSSKSHTVSILSSLFILLLLV